MIINVSNSSRLELLPIFIKFISRSFSAGGTVSNLPRLIHDIVLKTNLHGLHLLVVLLLRNLTLLELVIQVLDNLVGGLLALVAHWKDTSTSSWIMSTICLASSVDTSTTDRTSSTETFRNMSVTTDMA